MMDRELTIFSSRTFVQEEEKGSTPGSSKKKTAKDTTRKSSNWCQLVARIHGRAQAKLSGVFAAKEKMQVGIQAGIPFFPAMLPVGPGEIASIFAEDFYRFGAISLDLRIKNELGLVGRRKSGVLGGRRS